MHCTTRFAPSPTGYLHLGHAHSALAGWRRARAVGGRFLLRLEDIDPVRCRPEFAEAIPDDLRWLGLGWDGAVRVQSRHMAEYRSVLDTLSEREAGVVSMRFGLTDGQPKTLDEIGKVYGVTRERIRQIESKTMSKLRHPSRSQVLRDYLD